MLLKLCAACLVLVLPVAGLTSDVPNEFHHRPIVRKVQLNSAVGNIEQQGTDVVEPSFGLSKQQQATNRATLGGAVVRNVTDIDGGPIMFGTVEVHGFEKQKSCDDVRTWAVNTCFVALQPQHTDTMSMNQMMRSIFPGFDFAHGPVEECGCNNAVAGTNPTKHVKDEIKHTMRHNMTAKKLEGLVGRACDSYSPLRSPWERFVSAYAFVHPREGKPSPKLFRDWLLSWTKTIYPREVTYFTNERTIFGFPGPSNTLAAVSMFLDAQGREADLARHAFTKVAKTQHGTEGTHPLSAKWKLFAKRPAEIAYPESSWFGLHLHEGASFDAIPAKLKLLNELYDEASVAHVASLHRDDVDRFGWEIHLGPSGAAARIIMTSPPVRLLERVTHCRATHKQ